MKNGYLNNSELRKITRQFQELDSMIKSLGYTDKEQETCELLLTARNSLGKLLRWQSFDVAWKEARPADPSA